MNALASIAGPRETGAERRDRQLGMLRRLSELNMNAAESACARIDDAGTGAQASPTLDLARATRAVIQVITLENRIADGEPAPRPAAHAAQTPRAQTPRDRAAARAQTAPDPRRPVLREALHKLAAAEPDRAARAQLRRDVDECIEQELLDPDLPLSDAFAAICDELGFRPDLSKLPDELIGLPPRTYDQATRHPGPAPPKS